MKRKSNKKHTYKKTAHTGRRANRLLHENKKAPYLLTIPIYHLQGMLVASNEARLNGETPISKNRVKGFRHHAAKPADSRVQLYLTAHEARLLAAHLARNRFHLCQPYYEKELFEEIEHHLGKAQLKAIKNKIGSLEFEKEEPAENDGWGKEPQSKQVTTVSGITTR